MKHNPSIPCILISASLLLPFSVYSQEGGQSGGGDSAAEASVTGSATQKSVVAPDSFESSPIINIANAGLSTSQILTLSKDSVRAITAIGGASELVNLVQAVKNGSAKLDFIAKTAVAASAGSVTLNLSEVVSRAKTAKTYEDSGLTGDALQAKLDELSNPDYEYDETTENSVAGNAGNENAQAFLSFLKDLKVDLAKATTPITLSSAESKAITDAYIDVLPSDTSELTTFKENLLKALTGNYSLYKLKGTRGAYSPYENGGLLNISGYLDDETASDNDALTIAQITKFHPDVLAKFSETTDIDARYGLFLTFYELYKNDSNLVSSSVVSSEIQRFGELANIFFKDINFLGGISESATDISSVFSGYSSPKINLNYAVNDRPTLRFLSYLEQYNILGPNGDVLVSALTSKISDLSNETLSGMNLAQLASYLTYYTDPNPNDEAGGRNLGDNDLADYNIPLENISAYVGKNISLSGNINVSDDLTKASLVNNNVRPEDIRILAIAAANDINVGSDLTFLNDNKVEDHALVLAAADDLVVDSGSKIAYEGSNLAIASGDTMWLANVEIETGGNLAIASLNNLNITSGSKITAGGGGNTPNKDLVLLYANDLINIDSVVFGTEIREIHIDADRVLIKNVNLPSESIVRINVPGSRKWQDTNKYVTIEATNLSFTGSNPATGTVILDNVYHPQVGTLNDSTLKEVTSGI